MIALNRQVLDISETKEHGLNKEALSIEDFRENNAWILLGEPGAGKTTLFQQEAKTTGGQYMSVAEFITPDTDLPPEWYGKILFLDALDEIQTDCLIEKITRQLMRLGSPSFRVACRAANWYGWAKENLEKLHSDLIVLELVPLSDNDVLQLLQGLDPDPEKFIAHAKTFGIYNVLKNPEMLNLMVKAVQDGKWPKNRKEVYSLACQKLAQEDNPRHRHIHKNDVVGAQDILHAAGYLCAILLFTDKQGIALDESRSDNQFISIDSGEPEDRQAAALAVEKKIFISAKEERVTPSHRSVAEYLASDWLCEEIANKGLSINRLKQLLLDSDGHIKPSLWGLCGWLAQHNPTMRNWLVEEEPFAALYYGDVEYWRVEDKIAVFDAIIKIASFSISSTLTHTFSALALPQLKDTFKAILTDHHQFTSAQRECVLTILTSSDPVMPDFDVEVDQLLIEKIDSLERKNLDRNLLNSRMVSRALDYLYPQYLSLDKLFSYLSRIHANNTLFFKNDNLFLSDHIVDKTPISQLPLFVDHLFNFLDTPAHRQLDIYFQRLLFRLLLKVVNTCALELPIEQWINSLKLGNFLESEEWNMIKKVLNQWFSEHPQRYYELINFILNQSTDVYKNMHFLCYIMQPPGTDMWYFEKAAVTDRPYIRDYCLTQAVSLLSRECLGDTTSIKKKLDEWALSYPDKKNELQIQYNGILEQNQQAKKKDDPLLRVPESIQAELMQQLSAIQNGSAPPGVMGYLADVWREASEKKNTERENHFERRFGADGLALYQAAKEGFKHCLDRKDLPTAREIIEFHNQGKIYRLDYPCLIGMELIWQDIPAKLAILSEDAVASIIAFYFCSYRHGSAWVNELVKNYLEVIANVMINFAKVYKKIGLAESPINGGFYQFLINAQIVQATVPKLLQLFPLRSHKAQLVYLNQLLQSAFKQRTSELKPVILHKISLKGIDSAQKVYWYAAATLLLPTQYATELLNYVGKSSAKILTLANFIEVNLNDILTLYPLPENIIADFIELFTPHLPQVDVFPETYFDMSLIHRLIETLRQMPTEEAGTALLRLCQAESTEKIHPLLNQVHEAQQKHRQNRPLTVSAVAKILKQSIPANTRDLWALTLDKLDETINEIEKSNTNQYQFYWENRKTKQRIPAEEDICRNLLLDKLKAIFKALPQISCEPEMDYRLHKRADITLLYQQHKIPIEIKCDFNKQLWIGLKDQLINQYATAIGVGGYGIYVVFWFDYDGARRTKRPYTPGDGGRKVQTPEELLSRLRQRLTPEEEQKIAVRVIDVRWPQKNE